MGRYVDALTGWRGLAALLVVLFHTWFASGSPTVLPALARRGIDLTPIVSMGWIGVDIFFVLSGFVLALPAVLRDPGAPALGMTWGEFIRRRLLRVLPAYYVNLLILIPLAGYWMVPTHAGIVDAALKVTLTHNLWPVYADTINGVYWSLPVEWNFYLVMPFLLPLLARRRLVASLVAALALSLAIKLFGYATGTWIPIIHQLPTRIDQFLLGMGAAAASVFWVPSVRVAGWMFATALAGLVGWLYTFAAHFPQYLMTDHWITMLGRPGASIAIAVALWASASGARVPRALLANRAAVFAGLVSYSAYLWHLPILLLLVRVFGVGAASGGSTKFAVVLAATLPCVAAVSALSYWVVERPFLIARRGLSVSSAVERFVAAAPLPLLGASAAGLVALTGVMIALRAVGLVP